MPNITAGVVVERASGQHEMSLVAPFVSILGSASIVTAEVPPQIGQAFLAAARGGSADAPAPIRQDQMPSEETLRHISQILPRMLPSRDGDLDDPAVAAAVLVLVRTTSGRWLGSPAGDPAIISHGVTSVSIRTNALRWTATPAEAHHDLDPLLTHLILEAVSDLSRLPLRLTPTAAAGAEPVHRSSQHQA